MVLVLMAIGRVVLRIFGRGGACHCLGASLVRVGTNWYLVVVIVVIVVCRGNHGRCKTRGSGCKRRRFGVQNVEDSGCKMRVSDVVVMVRLCGSLFDAATGRFVW
jgi:hypothetical protein